MIVGMIGGIEDFIFYILFSILPLMKSQGLID
jgi:hypothetical protein